MKYKVDVLITYADLDNVPGENSGTGWVDNFKGFLEMMLEQVLGRSPNVLLKGENDTLSGADYNEVATFVPILGPGFIASEFCLNTLAEFQKITEKSIIQRTFKVLKSPLQLDEQPEGMRNLLGYDMFHLDMTTGKTGEFKDYFNADAASNYWMHMVDIAFDIHDALLGEDKTGKGTRAITSDKAVYLAETSPDLSVQRKIIKRELQRHGFKIYPDLNLPRNAADIESTIKSHLDKCSVSIHLIGQTYGDIPEGGDKSVTDLQTRLAATRAADLPVWEFTRLIWITPSLRNASEQQITFVENVKRDSEVSEGAEILQTPLEDFKNIVREELINGGIEKKKSNALLDDATNGKPNVYLIHDKVDKAGAEKISALLEKNGCTVLAPNFTGKLLDVREKHIRDLRQLDSAIIFHEKVNMQWVKMKALDLLKAPGFGRQKPIKGKALITDAGKDNTAFEQKGITVINNDKDIERSIGSFLEETNK